MSGNKGIPGFYYNRDKNRYFKLKPGEKVPSLKKPKLNGSSSFVEGGRTALNGSGNLYDYLVCREYGYIRRSYGLHSQIRGPALAMKMWKYAKERMRHFTDADTTLEKIACDQGGKMLGVISRTSGTYGMQAVYTINKIPDVHGDVLGMRLDLVFQVTNFYRCETQPIIKILANLDGLRTIIVMNGKVDDRRCCELLEVHAEHGITGVLNHTSSACNLYSFGCVGTSVKIPVDPTCFDVVCVGKDRLDVLAASAQFNEIKIYPSGTVYKTEKSDCLSLHFTKDCDLLCGHRNGKIYCRKYRQLFHSHSPPAQEMSVGSPGSGSAVIDLHSLPANSNLVISHSMNGQLALWDLRLRKLVFVYMSAYQDWASRLPLQLLSAISSDGNILAAAIHNTVKLWSTYTGENLSQVSLSAKSCPSRHLFDTSLTQQVPPQNLDTQIHSLCFADTLGASGNPRSLLVGHTKGLSVLL